MAGDEVIEVRGARVHNLKNIDVDVPLNQLVAVTGVSGSGKSSLAMGVLYAEGSRRYIEALSTYTRRRMGQAARADVDTVRHVPPALALRQRPGVPGVRSTFGTSTELLNVVRLMFSRLASHVCPNGHRQEPTLKVAQEEPFSCPVCGAEVVAPGAEDLAFNSRGACPTCQGIGTVRDVDDSTLIKDENLSIDEGTVLPWQIFGFNVQPQIVAEFGVRTDVPWRELTDWEKDIVLDGPEEKKHITVATKKGVHELDFTFRNARLTVTEELKRADNEKRLARVSRFLTERQCPSCRGTRLSEQARAPRMGELSLADVTAMTLDELVAWSGRLLDAARPEMRPMTRELAVTLDAMARRLLDLGLGYLSLDRASSTLSTGERQRVQLARSVRNETTGVLYVLDEPSIGLHPSNILGLSGVIADLLEEGNSVVMVDHEPLILRGADYVIELGPGAGASGGEIIATGSVAELDSNPSSRIGRYVAGRDRVRARPGSDPAAMFELGEIRIRTAPIHTVRELNVRIPRGRLTAVTGVSGSGKTTLVLESLVPALRAENVRSAENARSTATDQRLPAHVLEIDPGGIEKVNVVDSTPVGVNVRSTVGTYSGVLDDLRRVYANLDSAKSAGLTASDFSYNTGSLRCPRCEGTGELTLDVQFLPDIEIPCTECDGRRYAPQAAEYRRPSATGTGALSLPELLALTIAEASAHVRDIPKVYRKLNALTDVGLGYLTLGESTPALSGGEAQRLKLATDLGKAHAHTLFVFDEPTVGLHPDDVHVLIDVFDRLIQADATVVVVEHDLDLIANSDYVIDMGPGGGDAGGKVVATGTPAQVAANAESITGSFLREHLAI